MISNALGGVGLFLVGMVLVTDGLRAAAGDALRRALLRFTGGPLKALLSGATVTALVQSSSAISVATIGFVGAGLLTFEQALGLILGANVGTTATGWVVALLGLKFSVSTVALPLVGVGALIHLFTRGRWAQLGMALSGFGIIFVGIDVLQQGMEGLAGRLTPDQLTSDGFWGRLTLVGIGIAMTAVMQSSSAAVATTLTGLHSQAISLDQGAALVIGANIGTTVTAGMAALGASTAAKRTAFAHLLFNLITGAIALATLPAFVWSIERIGEELALGNETVLLATFHTAFNLLGVVLIFPFLDRFAGLVVRTIHDHGPRLTRLLDPSVASQGALATEAVRQTVFELAHESLRAVTVILDRKKLTPNESEALSRVATALERTQEYLATLKFAVPLSETGHERHLSTIHALDHIDRILNVALTTSSLAASDMPELRPLVEELRSSLQLSLSWTGDSGHEAPTQHLQHLYERVTSSRQHLRAELLQSIADGKESAQSAARTLETLRWLEELTYHLFRLSTHLRGERNLSARPLNDDSLAAGSAADDAPGAITSARG